MGNIKYLEEKFYKSKSAITAKLMERRREDVRDQGHYSNDVYRGGLKNGPQVW